MFDTICSLPLTSDVFAQVIHPSEPIVAVGVSAGHVQTFRLPPAPDPSEGSPISNEIASQSAGRRLSSAASENGLGEIETAWRTRRHKGSCRCLAYSPDGNVLYSAGTDQLVKAAQSEDGQVIGKIAIPAYQGGSDAPALLYVLTPQTLILSTDSAALYIYDVRNSSPVSTSSIPAQTYRPHEDYISSIAPLSPLETSSSGLPKQFLTTGGTTIAITDLRKGVIATSEDQEDELTSSLCVAGLKSGSTRQGEKAVVGSAGGAIMLWEKSAWDEKDERIVLDQSGEAVESLVKVPEGIGGLGYQGQQKLVAVGLGDGRVRFVRLGPNQIVQEMDVKHDDVEGVVGLGFDVAGRMVTGGGQIIKVWREASEIYTGDGGDSHSERDFGGDSDRESDTDEAEKPKSNRKRRKRGKGKGNSGGPLMAFDFDR